jgi:hypothetical protein
MEKTMVLMDFFIILMPRATMKPAGVKKKEGFQGQRAVVIPRNVLNLKCERNNIIGNLYITDIGYYPKALHHYRQRYQGAEQYILIFCTDGHGVVNLQHSDHKIAPGDYVVIPAGMRHSYAADPSTPWAIYWLHFKGTQAHHIVLHMQSQAGPVGFIQNREKVIGLFDEIYESLSRGYGSEAIMHANMCLWHLLSAFMNNRELDPPGESGALVMLDTKV